MGLTDYLEIIMVFRWEAHVDLGSQLTSPSWWKGQWSSSWRPSSRRSSIPYFYRQPYFCKWERYCFWLTVLVAAILWNDLLRQRLQSPESETHRTASSIMLQRYLVPYCSNLHCTRVNFQHALTAIDLAAKPNYVWWANVQDTELRQRCCRATRKVKIQAGAFWNLTWT